MKHNIQAIKIYFDKSGKNCQIIKPHEDFNGDHQSLVRDLFTSSIRQMDGTVLHYRNYSHYEIIKSN